jgi:hypothetical protein
MDKLPYIPVTKKNGMKYHIVAVPDGLICCLAWHVQGRQGGRRILEQSEIKDFVQGFQRSLGTRYLICAYATYATDWIRHFLLGSDP